MSQKDDDLLYVLGTVKKTAEISVLQQRQEIELSWSDGMVGVLPVFKTYEDANRYGDGKFQVLTICVAPTE